MDATDSEWIELPHPIDKDMIGMPIVLPRQETRRIPDATLRETSTVLVTHVGPHIEAPRYRFSDGDAIDDYPPER